MSISDVIGKARGTAGHWRVTREDRDGCEVATLWHYSTAMLTWNVASPLDGKYLDYSTGHGSVSDQSGMNQAFRLLGLPLYFSRKGGADILETSDPEQARRMPRYLWHRGSRREVRYTADGLTAEAERLGREAGESAGSWVVDGNTSRKTVAEVVRMIEEGDPALEAPAPLSGEWSGGIVAADVLASVGPGLDDEDPAADDVLDAFERGYSDGWYAEVERSARAVL
jgi:hypothetical protein